MNISSLLMSKLSAETEQQQNRGVSRGAGSFENIMSKMDISSKLGSKDQGGYTRREERQFVKQNDRAAERAERKASENKTVKTKGEKPEDKVDPNKNNKASQEPEKPKDATSTEKVSEAAETNTKSADTKSKPHNEDDIAQLSDIMGIAPEKIIEILDTLNISIEDLADINNFNQFLQMGFGVSSPVDLLSIPNIKDIISQMNDFVAKHSKPVSDYVDLQSSSDIDLEAGKSSEVVKSADANMGEETNDESAGKSQTDNKQQNVTTKADSETSNQSVANLASAGRQQAAVSSNRVNPNDYVNQDVNDEVFAVNNELNTTASKESVQQSQTVARGRTQGNVNTQDVINQLIEKMKVEYKGNTAEIRITLRPEHLGDVTLRVITENGLITAQFVAENQRIKEIIESQFSQLKSALEEQGIEVAELQVSVGQDQQEQRMNEFLREQQKSSRRLQNLIDGIAEEEDVASPEHLSPDSSVEYTA